MSKLSVRIEKFHKAVVVEVTAMDKRLRGKGELASCNEFYIYSEGYPEASEGCLHVRGCCKAQDNDFSVLRFESNKERDDWVRRARAALRKVK